MPCRVSWECRLFQILVLYVLIQLATQHQLRHLWWEWKNFWELPVRQNLWVVGEFACETSSTSFHLFHRFTNGLQVTLRSIFQLLPSTVRVVPGRSL